MHKSLGLVYTSAPPTSYNVCYTTVVNSQLSKYINLIHLNPHLVKNNDIPLHLV